MSLFRLDASIRHEGSTSRALADIVEDQWRATAPDASVVRRHVGLDPLPSDAWAAAVAGWPTPEAQRTAPQQSAVDLAGKPGVLVTVQGGNYAPGTPKEGWDHATAWMRRILEDVWHIDLDVVTRVVAGSQEAGRASSGPLSQRWT